MKLAPPNVEASDAPYFVDLVRDTLISKLDERQMNDQGYRIYTTLDPDLQKAAAGAVETGMKLVDDQVTKLRTKRDEDWQEQVRDQGTAGTSGAGGAGRDGSAHRRSPGAGRRAQLRHEPVKPRGGEASHRIDLQALRLCGGHEHGAGRLATRCSLRPPRCRTRRAPSLMATRSTSRAITKRSTTATSPRVMRWRCR